MADEQTNEVDRPQLYSISKEEFLSGDSKSDRSGINRSNFVDFLIDSFSFSRGKLFKQIAYLEWTRVNQKFDWIASFQNFLQAGCWDCLAPAEREHFIKEFERVSKHGPFPPDEPRATIHKVLEGQLKILADGSALRSYRGKKGILSDEQLRGLSRQELIKIAEAITD